jgi:hypothetical protein
MPLGGSPKASKPPPLPPPVKQIDVSAGAKAGEAERQRLQRRRGRRSAVIAGRRQLQPATVLKQKLGATA